MWNSCFYGFWFWLLTIFSSLGLENQCYCFLYFHFELPNRFEYLWPFWLLVRSIYDSFKYQGLVRHLICSTHLWEIFLFRLFQYFSSASLWPATWFASSSSRYTGCSSQLAPMCGCSMCGIQVILKRCKLQGVDWGILKFLQTIFRFPCNTVLFFCLLKIIITITKPVNTFIRQEI